VVAPPGLPPARLTELRRAFMDTLHDPAFRQDAERAKLDVEPLPGEALQTAMEGSTRFSPELIARAKAIAETRN
jgi:hypothetical protein